MAHHTNADKKVENFDEICIGTPIEIEKKINKLLPSAKSLKNRSIYLQMLSRLAVAQALQKKFKLAHKTLDKAENELTPEQTLAQVRLLLERGRVFIIAYDFKAALPHIKKCYQLSKKYKLELCFRQICTSLLKAHSISINIAITHPNWMSYCRFAIMI